MKKRTRLLGLLLALALCLSGLSVTAYAADSSLNYLALGDSITSYYGVNESDGFVSKLADKISATATNKGNSGLTTTTLLSSLSDYTTAIQSADVITITIGGNDLMEAVYTYLGSLLNMTAAQVQAYVQTLDFNSSTTQYILSQLSTSSLASNETFTTACQNCVSNINSITAKIRELNPDAVILVANQYNPYQWLGNDTISSLFDAGVKAFNSLLNSEKTSNYTIVDIYSTFSSSTSTSLTNASINSSTGTANLDFHPNAAGHTKIAEAMASAYNSYALSVSSSLTDITSSNSSAIHMKGVAYTTTLTADTGYSLPSSVTVTVGGTTLTAETDYTYDSSTGELTIPASAVTGNIVITAAGVDSNTVTVTYTYDDLASSNEAKTISKGTAYTTTLTATTGYSMPDSITVTVGGTTLTAGTDYTYNSATGQLTIPADEVTGDIVITAGGVATFTVKYDLTKLTSSNTTAKWLDGDSDFTTTLTPSDGYSLPDGITVTAGDTPLSAETGYTYNSTTGALTIYGSAFSDWSAGSDESTLTITAAGVENTETVTAPTLTAIARSDDSESAYLSGTWTASKTVVITASGST
ncbi:MAG: GDSL-type esterase/lipase family protein, partial [Clostridiales bacterium]|nr:GDSL-type esterase/lipase family protein [Clostridiales bacterium]